MKRLSLVFIPGTLCTSAMFKQQVAYLNAHFPDLDIHAVDFSTESTLCQMSQTVIAKVGGNPFLLAGFSMGGFVALDILRRVGEKCIGLALLNSNAHADLPGREALRAEHLVQAKTTDLISVVESLYLPNYLARNDDTLEKLILDMAEKCGIETFENQLKVLAARPDCSEFVSSIDIPFLLIGGEQDKLCPPSEQQRISALNHDAQLELLADCGHFSPIEKPQEVSQILANWLQEIL